MVSVRFSGLEVEVGRVSPRTSGNFVAVDLDAPERSRCILCRDDFSMLMRGLWLNASARLLKLLFSWPKSASCAVGALGAELPESEVMLSARFSGLLGGWRGRFVGFDGAALGRAERRESLTPDRNGVANGVCDGVVDGYVEEVGTADVAGNAVFGKG